MCSSELDEARVVVLAMRAALAGESRPERALADARLSRGLAAGFDDRRLAAMAEVGEGWALAELGCLTEAARVLESACIRFDGALQPWIVRSGANWTQRDTGLLGEGKYWVKVTQLDLAGTPGDSGFESFYVDRVPPVVSLTTPAVPAFTPAVGRVTNQNPAV